MTSEPTTPRTADAIAAATGISWSDWAAWLDAHDGASLAHAEIASLAHDRLAAGDRSDVANAAWWAQGVAVAYEQQIGRRLPGQRQDGTFSVSASRTLPVDPQKAMDAWVAQVGDRTVLAERTLAGPPRTSSTDRRSYWRIGFTDGSSLQLAVEEVPSGSRLTATHEGLASPEEREAARTVWKATLAHLSWD